MENRKQFNLSCLKLGIMFNPLKGDYSDNILRIKEAVYSRCIMTKAEVKRIIKNRSKEDINKRNANIVKHYKKGTTINAICKRYFVGPRGVYKILRENNVTLRSKSYLDAANNETDCTANDSNNCPCDRGCSSNTTPA